jgi:2'-5' RNA ligase
MFPDPLEHVPEPLEHRVFFATRPDELTGARMVRLTRRLAEERLLRGRPMHRSRLHATLGMVGVWPDSPPADAIDLARRIGNQIAMRSFKVTFKRLQSWRRSSGPLVLVGDDDEVVGLRWLHDALYEMCGAQPEPHFCPHISLIWSRDSVSERAVEPFSWMVREFVLIHSVYGQGRHEVLARWPLQAH